MYSGTFHNVRTTDPRCQACDPDRSAPARPASAPMAASTKEQEYRRLSLWWDGLPGAIEPRKPLEADTSADVAIVGAGFTGLWCAYYLKRQQRHLRVVIIEREVAGFGPAGRNAGWASGGIPGNW